ncbi:MAG TPA: tripartite tricarboxylate transporter substrate binding protein [Thermodesulfobacteriota bacterium]
MSRIKLVAVGLAVAFAAMHGVAHAQTAFPTKPVRILVHTAAGSGSDLMARELGKVLEGHLGQPVVIENRTGGGGAVALTHLLGQPADGYTVSVITMSQIMTMAAGRLGQIRQPDQLTWLARVQGDPILIVVRTDSPLKSVRDLNARVKEAAASGNLLKIGSYGRKTHYEAAVLDYAQAVGARVNYIAYEGTPEILRAVLGGEIDVAFAPASGSMANLEGGTIRPLASLSAGPVPGLAAVPTLKESGIDVVVMQYRGLVAKPGMPAEVLAKWETALKAAVVDPRLAKATEQEGMVLLADVGHEALLPIVTREFEKAKAALGQ